MERSQNRIDSVCKKSPTSALRSSEKDSFTSVNSVFSNFASLEFELFISDTQVFLLALYRIFNTFFKKVKGTGRFKSLLLFVFLLVVQTSILLARDSYRQETYKAYIKGNLQEWKAIIDEMEKANSSKAEDIVELIEYQYGYIAWCIGNNKKREAKEYLEFADKNLERLDKIQSLKPDIHAFKAAFYGFRIGINPLRAPFYGAKSLKNAEMALEIDSTNIRANLEMGNIWYHMPKMFGGSDKKALVYYNQALINIQKKEHSFLKHNWMYLNILALNGQAELKMGNTQRAMLIFEKALEVEPDFIWVKDELLPTLKAN